MEFYKRMSIFFILAFIGINLNAQENGWTFKSFFGGGGGIDLFWNEKASIYFEAGYLQQLTTKLLE